MSFILVRILISKASVLLTKECDMMAYLDHYRYDANFIRILISSKDMSYGQPSDYKSLNSILSSEFDFP